MRKGARDMGQGSLLMSKNAKIKAAVLLLFFLMTFIQIFPLSIKPANSLPGTKDPLLNTWVLAWDYQRFFSRPLALLESNYFYPHPGSLKYTDSMLPQAVLSIPFYFLSRNPVLAHNAVLFLSFILNAYAMFLLVRHLTGSDAAGVSSGMIFAFSAFQIQHLEHLPLLSSWFIPLSFLYLHKFFKNRSLKNSLLFSLFFTLQVLSSIYYGLLFLSILAAVLPFLLLINRRKKTLSLLLKLGLPLILSGILLIPFVLPLLSIFKEHVFKGNFVPGAGLTSYLAVSGKNVFLGPVLSSLGTQEKFLFPGIAALLLLGTYIYQKRNLFRYLPGGLKTASAAFMSLSFILAMVVNLTGGFSIKAGFISFSAHNPSNAAYVFLVTLFLYVVFSLFFFVSRSSEKKEEDSLFFFYLFLLLWSVFLSFGIIFSFLGHSNSGLPLPFKWLQEYISGFKGIQFPSRYGIFVLFSISVLAGWGLKCLLSKLKKNQARVFAVSFLLLFLNLEYLSIPQKTAAIPLRKDVPPSYIWLKGIGEEEPLIELPLFPDTGEESIYMYFSLFHKKKIVNGYSGFIPPAFLYIRQVFNTFPSRACMDILNNLGVKYAMLHLKIWSIEERSEVMNKIKNKFSKDLKLIKEFRYAFDRPTPIENYFGYDRLYRVKEHKKYKKNIKLGKLKEIPPGQWKIKASQNRDLASLIIDRSMETKWTTETEKRSGDSLLIKFKKPKKAAVVSLFLEPYSQEYALDMEVETSEDGKNWEKIKRSYSPGEFTRILVNSPEQPVQNIYLKGKSIRFLRITQIGYQEAFPWSVAEMKIYKRVSSKQ